VWQNPSLMVALRPTMMSKFAWKWKKNYYRGRRQVWMTPIDWPTRKPVLIQESWTFSCTSRDVAHFVCKIPIFSLPWQRDRSEKVWKTEVNWRSSVLIICTSSNRIRFYYRTMLRRAQICQYVVCPSVRPSVRPSLCLSVRDVQVPWSHRLEYLENNFTAE